ncbi:MAG: DUF2264 domain-containing protein [Propionibacteriaceae bacterium]|jgi:hypothetical protein|nr:DUF2264 domain-containing protein [Propionibacteriaceae bacterium]
MDERLIVERDAALAPAWPPPDWRLSPHTGWTREHWEALADRLLLSVRHFASPGHGGVLLPGPEGGYGRAVDRLEGFARTFLLAGFRLAGAEGDDRHNLAEWYAQGIAEGVDPASPDRWVRLTEHPQAKVEAASLALILDLTREQIWDRLDGGVQERVIAYLSPAVGDQTYPKNNWLWFRVVVETFLRSVGGPWSADDLAQGLALHDSFRRADGWLSDGHGRCFDHYTGWALQLYPTLWQRMAGATALADDGRRQRDRAQLGRYLEDLVHLVGADGGPLIQGRSLIYRQAAAAAFWAGAMAEVPALDPGLLRRAASGVARHFHDHGVPDEHGRLTLGWFRPWPRLAQSYSGPGSPYWAAKGFLGLALPRRHPVWTAVEQPLPVEQSDFLRVMAAPGWVAAGRRADGLVRVANHGTDHAHPGDLVGDSPLYARLGYSSATFPALDLDAWANPPDQSVALLDRRGRASHRAGFRTLALEAPPDGPALAASAAQAHWLDPDPEQVDHGSGWTGRAQPAGRLTVVSILRPGWEARGVLVQDPAPEAEWLRLSGWPVAGPDQDVAESDRLAVEPDQNESGPGQPRVEPGQPASEPGPTPAVPALSSADLDRLGAEPDSPAPESAPPEAAPGRLYSSLVPLTAGGRAGTMVRADASPLGGPTQIPHLDYPVRPGAWTWVLIGLVPAPTPGPVSLTTDDAVAVITWPDGIVTRSRLPLPTGQAVRRQTEEKITERDTI